MNITSTIGDVLIEDQKIIIPCLNGHSILSELTGDDDVAIDVSGKLTIVDCGATPDSIKGKGGTGIKIESGGEVFLQNITVSNFKTGVDVPADGVFTVSGDTTITDNEGANVSLADGALITVDNKMVAESKVSVTTATKPTAGAPVVITTGLDQNNVVMNGKCFLSDDDDYVVENSTGNPVEAQLVLNIVLVDFNTGIEGVTLEQQKHKHGETVDTSVFSTLKQEGKKIEGWYTDESFAEDKKWDMTTKLSKDITLYAKWVEDKHEHGDFTYEVSKTNQDNDILRAPALIKAETFNGVYDGQRHGVSVSVEDNRKNIGVLDLLKTMFTKGNEKQTEATVYYYIILDTSYKEQGKQGADESVHEYVTGKKVVTILPREEGRHEDAEAHTDGGIFGTNAIRAKNRLDFIPLSAELREALSTV